jgi:large-conductance mechanosensitive channel
VKSDLKRLLYIIIEILILFFTITCFKITYSIYWGDAITGQSVQLIFVFFGWVPAVIGFILIPVNIFMVTMIIMEWQNKRGKGKDELK